MTSMRLRLNLRGYKFKYDIYTWGGSNWSFVLLDDRFALQTYTWIENSEVVFLTFGATGSALWNTDKFIYPLTVKPIAILDGLITGNLEYRLYSSSSPSAITMEKIEVILKSIDSDGNETNLTDLFTIDNINWVENASESIKDFVFFFQITNKKITTDDRLLLETKVYGSTSGGGGDLRSCERRAYANQDDQNVNIPIV